MNKTFETFIKYLKKMTEIIKSKEIDKILIKVARSKFDYKELNFFTRLYSAFAVSISA